MIRHSANLDFCRFLMKQRIDSDTGHLPSGRRFVTVEPVVTNIRHKKDLDRFTLLGSAKIGTQGKRYYMVLNIQRPAHYGLGRQC